MRMFAVVMSLASLLPTLAFAQAVDPAANPLASSQYASMVPLLAIFAVFYFLLIRPQQKLRRQHQSMLSELKKGDEVVTGGGIVGRVTKVDDSTVQVEIAKGMEVVVVKSTITTVMGKEQPSNAAAKKSIATKNDNVVPSKNKVANDN
jgi:preprotein translocase subunit YajC